MRISDWSSDVCSSDLRMTKDGEHGEARAFADAVLAVLIPVLIVFSALLLIVMPWVMGLFASDALRADGATFDLAVLMARKIGSASCRDRVCQYVYISVVAVSFKKN